MPTPTGTLQGVAAASWDGSVWQPSGRTMASVGTPTGVLRGVAPFSWDGSAWQPIGRPGPGVATPAGTLDGVALYTWNGSAWTPNGGGTTPTPSGTLQGVAGFYWDGAAWQPAGRAGPEVATPYGVLAGMAMFSWSGTAWVPAGAPPALDLNLLTGPLDPRVTFARASIATYFDAGGLLQTAALNVPRFDNDPVSHVARGLLVEEARTNLIWQSGAIQTPPWASAAGVVAGPTVTANAAVAPDGTTTATRLDYPLVSGAGAYSGWYQSVITTAAAYAFSIYLRGNVGGERLYLQTMDGGTTYYRLPVTLTTAWQRLVLVTPALTAAPWYFYPGTDLRDGTQTSTPAQTIFAWGAQVEAGTFPTSYIPTAGASVTRAADTATLAAIPGRNATAETFVADFQLPSTKAADQCIVGSATSGLEVIYISSTMAAGANDVAGAVVTANVYTLGSVGKAASTWAAPNSAKLCLNGGAVAASSTFSNGYSSAATVQLMGNNNLTNVADGYIRRFRYWPRVLSNAEMQQVTT